MGLKNPSPDSEIVFFDIRIGESRIGRMVIELRSDVVPKTAANFKALCIGDTKSIESNVPLTYKGTRFHKVQRLFMAQGGDVIKNNGTSGESIYGPTFEDENFTLTHEEGAVSMANYGKPNSNNSQFFIAAMQCAHLDGTNVVVGYVLRGFGIIGEMEKFTTDEGVPTVDMIIYNCGTLSLNGDWNYYEADDNLPPFPSDWAESESNELSDIVQTLETIKVCGNRFYEASNAVDALRKYEKFKRYYEFFRDRLLPEQESERSQLLEFHLVNSVNAAACHLKLGQFGETVTLCTEVLQIRPDHTKALYRRGVAQIEMKNYEKAFDDLKKAHALAPDDMSISAEFERNKQLLVKYRDSEKDLIRRMFTNH